MSNHLRQDHTDGDDARTAITSYEQQLAAARAIGDQLREANALGNLGNIHRNIGDTRMAITYYAQAFAVMQVLGDDSGTANALAGLGNAHADRGDARTAITYHTQAWRSIVGLVIGTGKAPRWVIWALRTRTSAMPTRRSRITRRP